MNTDAPPDSEQRRRPVLADSILSRSALRSLPDPAPLIDGVLDMGTVALVYGPWGVFKTFITIDWAASVATGRSWQSCATEQCDVLYVAAEGAFGLKARLEAWEVGWRTTIDDGRLDTLPQPVNLTNASDVRNLGALIAERRYGLVILDTLSRCMVGADENSAQDCGIVVDTLHQLRACTRNGRGVILGVHHTGKDGKTFRGSSVFEAGADTVYSVSADGGVITLNREKRKDGPEYDRHELRFDPIEGTGSGVISVHRWGGQTDRADKLMDIFVQHFVHTGATKAELRNVAKLPNATFHRGLSDLLNSGALTNTGTDKRPFYKTWK